ncbi:transmembrane gtpase fzo1 [Moniliophthora roreri MCA 2997]|uniref:Transmembrane gtpase fzo1 n=1 Tax=Moniliophthora roreri (strain MCA 2997) TaxID=1381753 RepID=V2XT32_MONRO|nr:transmembrane gtpase fzo1 [Moniliophthora roreri MCA 2997]
MPQPYFPPRVTSPVKELANFSSITGERQLKVEDVQEQYIEQKDRLVNALDSTKSILNGLRKFNKEEWVVRYPQLRESASAPAEEPKEKRRKSLRRSMTFADDPTRETEVVVKQGLTRSVTLSSITDVREEQDDEQELPEDESLLPNSDFRVLRLDLKLGANRSATAASLVSQLEKASIANLLDDRIESSLSHVDKLRLRVEDTSSKVLVTGDLNAGKSTFVNALLRREVMPVDQQPCTTAFCEVHDAAENQGKEEVHIIKAGAVYDINDESTFTRASLSELEDIVSDNESSERMLKLYLADTRTPAESLLNNGVVDISLIDAPGLNRDSLKTTALFARQEEIDVVVFVVSAENHFTLSAREFLLNASKEKAYLFIVVNKYDQIKNKEKCRRLVLEQIKELSPRTWQDAQDLVHFVDSAAALQPYTANPSFDDLESSLRSFVLVKRSKSKLQPVSTYLNNLLCDIDILAGANAIVANSELEQANAELSQVRPVLERMKQNREVLEDSLDSVEEDGATSAAVRTKSVLNFALERVGQGKLGVDRPLVPMPSYPGILGIWDYARNVRRALVASIDAAVKLAEDEARVITSTGVDKIKNLADEHLPEGVERNKRVFIPEAMFSAVRRGKGAAKSRRSSSYGNGAVVAGGIHGLGIGLAQRPDMLETTFLDLFDVHHQFWLHFGDGHDSKKDEDSAPTALGLVSVGLGAVTMVGGQAIGAKGLIEGIIRVTDLFGNETARKWAAPVIGAFTIGLTAYLVLELPNSIPKTVGRRVKAAVERENADEENAFVEMHAGRISRETRKVLRLASWDLKGRFNSALEERGQQVKAKEEQAKKATRAKEYFTGVGTETGEVRVHAGLGVEAA